jgi:hypothetical protein
MKIIKNIFEENQKRFFFSFTNLFKIFCIFILFIFNHKYQNSFSFSFKYSIKTLFLFKSSTISLLLSKHFTKTESKQISFSHSFKSNFRFLSLEQLFIPNLNIDQIWKQDGTTTAGGHGNGNQLNQVSMPCGLFIDDDQTIYVADTWNHRIVEWKRNANNGQIVAGGNEKGDRNDQLNHPAKVIIDKENDSLIICDFGNQRMVRWPRRNGGSGEILISNIACHYLMMDNDGYFYVSDYEKHAVTRWKMGETEGTIVAGGNGQGNRLDQLNCPANIFIDEDHSVYVSDERNHRVMK